MPADSPRLPGSRGTWVHRAIRSALSALLCCVAAIAGAADPIRGERLYTTAPATGLLACFECHGEAPSVNNFGNIFAGHNAVALIQRAVSFNTGGMGYFSAFYSPADLADIAAYLGNTPARLTFADTTTGTSSAAQRVTISPGTKSDIRSLSLSTEGDFAIEASDCGTMVPRFERCHVDVAFRPSAAGELSGVLRIAHDGTPTPVRIALAGTGLGRPPAVARLRPAALDFPPTPAGTADGPRLTLTLSNASDERLTLAGAAAGTAAFRIAGGDCVEGRTLAPGESCVLSVAFEPGQAGATTGEVVIRHDGVGGASRAALAGTATSDAAAAWQTRPAQVDFGSVELPRRSAPRTLLVRNTSAATVAVDDIVSNRPEFEVLAHDCAAAPLAPGAACRVVAAMRPVRAGALATGLAAVSGGTRTPLEVLLHGRGSAAGSQLTGPPRLQFTAPAAGSALLSAQVVQHGVVMTAIDGFELEGADATRFEILPAASDGDCRSGLKLLPGAGCAVQLRYTPAGAGPHAAVLVVRSRGDSAAARVALSGRGDAGPASPSWTIDAGTLTFDSLPGTRSVTVRNLGPGRWTLARAVVTPSAGSGFAFRGGTCTAASGVAPGASCTLLVGFEPLPARPASATLVLQAQGSASTAAVSLVGEAAAPAAPLLRFETPLADFGTKPASTPASRVLALRNEGGATAAPPRFEVSEGLRIARLSPACTAALPAGARCDVEVQWQPAAPGLLRGLLRASSGGTTAQATVTGNATGATGRLSWQTTAGQTSHAATRVGTLRAGPWQALVNTGTSDVRLPAWHLSGPAAQEFSLDPAGTCLGATTLAPGASCMLRLVFHPRAPGLREATLVANDEVPGLAPLVLRARAHAPPWAGLDLQPREMRLAAVPGARTPAAFAWLANDGAAAVTVERLELLGSAFALAPAAALAHAECGNLPFALLPGEGCAVAVEWDGAASAQQGGTLRVTTASGESTDAALAVVEDLRDRQNVGAGGGASSVGWLLALMAATLWLARRRRTEAESRHVPD